MTRDELSFEMYVVLGNALHLLVSGVKPEDQQRLGMPVAELQRLHAWLEPLRANELASAVESLPDADRRLLAEAVALCERLADTQAEHLMGAPAEVRAEVLDALRSGNGERRGACVMSFRRRLVAVAVGACLVAGLTGSACGQRDTSLPAVQASPSAHWVASWTTALEAPYGTETLPVGALNGMTLRETVHLSLGGNRLRVRLSNLFGDAPLVLRNVTVAMPAGAKPDGSIVPTSWKPVLFGGQSGVAIAPGQEIAADPLNYNVRAGAELVISLSVTTAPEKQTLHAGARATEFLLAGDHAEDASLPGATTNTRWYFLSGVDVEERSAAPVVVAFGDSITDGHGATTDGNDRWTDDLFRRLRAASPTNAVAIVNEGIGGNCVLQVCVGSPATERFQRDVLEVPGAKTVIVLEGINDLGALSRKEPQPAAMHAALIQNLEAAFTRFVADAHTHGIRALGGTLTPWMGAEYYHPDAHAEADRVALNTWILTSRTFDGVIDFDAAVRDPQRPDHMLPAYDSGDHLHPGPAGYQRMADAVDLATLKK